MSRPEYGSDLHLWPVKPEVSPLREEPHGVWITGDLLSPTEVEAAKPYLEGALRDGNTRVTVFGRTYVYEEVRPVVAVARSTDPGTSWEAARSITPEERSKAQNAVLYALRKWGPCTDEALGAHFMGISPSGLRTRRSELVAMGLVRDSGRKDVLRSGRRAIVWEAV